MADGFQGGAARTGVDRAAIFLLTLGEKEAAEVLRHMSAQDVQLVGTAMTSIIDVTRDEISDVVATFMNEAERQTSLGAGTTDFVRKALISAMGEDEASGLLDQIQLGRASKGLEALRWMEPRTVVDLIRNEHPQIIALVLSYLEPEKTAKILALLPEPMHSDLMLRVATLDGVQPAALQELHLVMERQFQNAGRVSTAGVGGPRAVAEILNSLGPKAQASLIGEITAVDEPLGTRIQDLMYTFDDLMGLEDRAMQEVLRQVPTDVLLLALKATDEALKEKIFKNMSQRAAETLRDDLEARGPVRLVEVEAAQKEITATARRLAEEGTINLGPVSGEDYV
jgi:flagellar motor switch protein FliG